VSHHRQEQTSWIYVQARVLDHVAECPSRPQAVTAAELYTAIESMTRKTLNDRELRAA
jgi:hypothetical protein